ncbi:Uu.00g064580.m01.CDS01 [Anthostomella pinea]|uniref:Uu.00g064580.m01.CDS01 n=1 Tax=Anthostomella pinea TaxID=933095 RepID=A0AAI8YN31_9PEZI|nr:Uu.00g064580.m01.CDS01 [Anthostomella pinea]
MRFLPTVIAVLAAAQGAFALDVQKAVIVTFPKGTQQDIVKQAMDDIREAGGKITHEYKLIKGFAARAPQTIIDSVKTWSAQYKGAIEMDQMAEIQTNNAH